jgi:uncharacterized protein GlcG (DUF336 family)
MIAASQDKARELGMTGVSTAIVDPDGRLFAFARMEGTHWLSIEVAQNKAFTGALLWRDGSELEHLDPGLIASLTASSGRALMPLASVTTVRDGTGTAGRHPSADLVASIGCSGGSDEQDKQCAEAARDAYVG